MKVTKPAAGKPSSSSVNKGTHPKTGTGKRRVFPYTLGLAMVAFMLYGQSLRFEFAMDDNIVIKLNRSVQKGTSGFGELFTKSMVFGSNGRNDGAYRPLTMMSFALDKQLFGNQPGPFHLVNVLLYALTGVLLFFLLHRLFPSWHLFYPFLVSLLFITHPIHTEVVANIKSRDELLSFLLSMASLLVLFKWQPDRLSLALPVSFLLFLLGCLAKETALTLVVMAPLTLYFFTRLPLKQVLLGSLPFVAGALVYMMFRTAFLDHIGSATEIKIIDNTLMAAKDASEKYATILYITWKYLWLLIFPHPLSWDYSFRQIPLVRFSEIRVILPMLLFLAMFAFAVIGIKSRKMLAWCILFFFATLALVSNIFVPIAATMAERFLYFPSLAFCMALFTGITAMLKQDLKKFSWASNRILLAVFGILISIYMVKTYNRTGDWRNNLLLFEAGVKAAPNSTRTHSALAYEYSVQAESAKTPEVRQEFYSKSIEEFKQSLSIFEGNKEGWYNIAHTYDIMGEYNEAETYYKKAIQMDPKAANAYNNLGAIYLRKRQFEAAIPLFHEAVKLDKNYADPFGNLGAAYHFQNNYAEAIRYYEQALAINPGLQTVLNNIAKARQSLLEQQASPKK